jgi:hypothetical protein
MTNLPQPTEEPTKIELEELRRILDVKPGFWTQRMQQIFDWHRIHTAKQVDEAEEQARANALYEAADLVADHPHMYQRIMERRTEVLYTQQTNPNQGGHNE